MDCSASFPVFQYVGPRRLYSLASQTPKGKLLSGFNALREWIRKTNEPEEIWATYVVSLDCNVLIAERQYEHVTCAGRQDVLGAGEVLLSADAEIMEISNYSTGYCPDVTSIHATQRAFARCCSTQFSGFSYAAEFRKCSDCGARNVVRDSWFFCAVCDSPLNSRWNFESPDPICVEI